jgi:hypothetical protein
MAALIGISVKPKNGGATATVPVNSLAQDGVPPEEGDKISAQIEGTVKSVDGNEATVSIDSINGEPVAEEAGESPEEEASEGEGNNTPGGGAGGGGPTAPASRAATAGLGAALRKGARGRPMPF